MGKKNKKNKEKKLQKSDKSTIVIGDTTFKTTKDVAQDVRRFLAEAMDPPKPIKRPDVHPADFLNSIKQRANELAKDIAKIDKSLQKLYDLEDDRMTKEDAKFVSNEAERLYQAINYAINTVIESSEHY